MDAVERVIATLEAQVVGAEATLGAVGNAEERANVTLVAKNARNVTRGAPAHDFSGEGAGPPWERRAPQFVARTRALASAQQGEVRGGGKMIRKFTACRASRRPAAQVPHRRLLRPRLREESCARVLACEAATALSHGHDPQVPRLARA